MNGTAKAIGRARYPLLSKLSDYGELMKPELTGLSVLTSLCGFYLASSGPFHYILFVHLALGTALLGGGAGALNQFIEREYDSLMKRTERRPLPAGRLEPSECLTFGIVIAAAGMLELTLFVNILTGFLAAVTFATYIFLYTPLKRITPYSTLVGAIPGALPPVMGWTAARNSIGTEAAVLFAILFCWQMPHFLSLAWMYRRDYARAGFKILTVDDPGGRRTSRQILAYSIGLVPVSLAPAFAGMTGLMSVTGAAMLSLGFLSIGVLLARQSRRSPAGIHAADPVEFNFYSRRMFFASLVYLPCLMLLLTIDKV
ncbi:MAG TPA: heme o synthase [Bacteroidota bacterium]|jgi:protoheme IX farnesyltransferase